MVSPGLRVGAGFGAVAYLDFLRQGQFILCLENLPQLVLHLFTGNTHGTLPRDRTPAHRGYGRSRPRNSGTRHSRDGCFRCSLPSAPARFPALCSPRPPPAGPYPPRRRRCRITHWRGRCQAWGKMELTADTRKQSSNSRSRTSTATG